MGAEFTHLHLHTDYSLLDGACDVEKLMKHVKGLGQKSVAMTDHGNIYGAVHFFDAAKKAGIKPILGCELYICKVEDHDRTLAKSDDQYNHLLVLAENETGYRNLVRLTSEAALRGFYNKPRVSKKYLAEHAEGLIGFSGCLKGEVTEHLVHGRRAEAKATAGQFEDIFGKGNFFLEVQDHHLDDDPTAIKALFELEQELGIPLVATNDSHYVSDLDSRAHEILLCVQTGSQMSDEKRFRFKTQEFYIKSAQQMAELFPQNPEVLKRTMQFAERCNLTLNKVENPFPKFDVPKGETTDSYFERICREGFQRRRDVEIRHLEQTGKLKHTIAEYEQRLTREIDCIKLMKFPSYFLIVWDFIRYARELRVDGVPKPIPVGPGRGSAAGSLVAYVLGITNIDPLQGGLLFERFLNPERVSLPDIDIDFCMNRRGEVIEYVRDKYGSDQVAQIITFNTMAAKAAIKDVGRALGMPYGEVDRIAKMVPAVPEMTLEKAFKDSPALVKEYESNPQVREVIDAARRLEGLVRGAGVHAAGVVIAPQPLIELVPVTRNKAEEIVTAYDMKAIEKMGLIKMDFLGLTTLTVIDDALKMIEENRGVKVDLAVIPLDDKVTYEKVFHHALTSGIFQFESSGMRDVLRRYKPSSVEDLTALNALYRPGPIQGGMIDDFIDRKLGRKTVEYMMPELEPLLKETLGVIVYQEQVMQIANEVSGYSLGEADVLRRAMGKKDAVEMGKLRERFMRGAEVKNHPKETAGRLFDLIEQFAGYGFNKSHSAAYALLAYQTAYLKTHYPTEFMAALLTSETSKPENVVKYIQECREMEIAVEPPDVQHSAATFTPMGEVIRFGLTAIKNVGGNAIESITDARKKLEAEGKKGFAGLWEFCEKVDLRVVNKRVLESLIKAGAMDSFGPRAALTAALDKGMELGQKAQRDTQSGQSGLFGLFDGGGPTQAKEEPLPRVAEWDENLRLQNEKEVLGFFVSGHPMDKYAEKLRNMKVVSTADALEMKPEPQQYRRGAEQQNEIQIAGVLSGVKVAKSKRGGMYAAGTLEDTMGRIEIIVFSSNYEKLAEKLKIDVPVLVRGTLLGEEDASPKLSVSGIQALEDVKIKLPEALRIRIPLHSGEEALLEKLAAVFQDKRFIDRVEELVGVGGVKVVS